MRARTLLLLAVAAAFALFSGCASLAHGPLERIDAVSEPSGADVTVTCQGKRSASGVTPATMLIHRRLDDCSAEFTKTGFVTERLTMERTFSRAYWGNVVLASALPIGLVAMIKDARGAAAGILTAVVAGAGGLIYDRVSGAMYDHREPLRVTLRPVVTERQE